MCLTVYMRFLWFNILNFFKPLLAFYALFAVCLLGGLNVCAQPYQPFFKFYNKKHLNGYYFLVPYKMDKSINPFTLLILNKNGEPLFYKTVNHSSDFKIQPNGSITYFSNNKHFVLNYQFEIIDSVACVGGAETDSHDFIILPNGHYILIGRETVEADYSNQFYFMKQHKPGSNHAKVKYGIIQELDKDKKLVYQWSTKNLFKPQDADLFYLKDTQNIDLTHFNSIDVDDEGNYIVSARYFNEVFKVNKLDSSIMWHMGGKRNEIKVLNDTIPFYGQHDARIIAPYTISIFDNGYTFDSLRHSVRALEYKINDKNKTALLNWEYIYPARLISEANGNVQQLPNNHVLISYGKIEFGTPNLTFEIINKKSKKAVLQAYFTDTMGTYRTFYYKKLPFKIPTEKLLAKNNNGIYTISTPKKYATYIWSDGSKEETLTTNKKGTYFVYLSVDGISFFRSKKIILK